MSYPAIDLVLVKAATVRQHLRENLRAMQLGLNSPRVTYSYHRKWLAPGVLDAIEPGATVLVALGNSPYATVVPLRLARLVDLSDRDGLVHELELHLGDFLEPDGVAFGRELAAQPSRARPGGAFVVPPPPGFRPTVVQAGDHARVWRQTVDALRTHPSYAGSVFLRLDGYEVGDARLPAEAGAPSVPPGTTLSLVVESRNDHLLETDRAEVHLLADASAWSLPLSEPLVAQGTMRFPVAVEADDGPRLEFSVGARPRWADSSILEITVPVLEDGAETVVPAVEPPPAEPPPVAPTPLSAWTALTPAVAGLDTQAISLRPTDGQRLLQALRRDGWSPSLAVLEDHLLRWFPGDPRLEEARVRLQLEAGEEEAAAASLAALPADVTAQIDPWLRFRAAAHRGDGEARSRRSPTSRTSVPTGSTSSRRALVGCTFRPSTRSSTSSPTISSGSARSRSSSSAWTRRA